MRKYDDLAGELLLKDPQDGNKLEIVTPLSTNEDGSYSFEVENPKTRVRYRHTIKTEEI